MLYSLSPSFVPVPGAHTHAQGVPMEDVLRVLRKRFGTSGIEEKAGRKPKQ